MSAIKVIIHGGFFSESSTDKETKSAKQKALTEIVKASYTFLEGHSAIETVAFAVELLENDALFNAGTGSQIQSDGKIRMSASIMNGETKKFTGVINLENVKNPVRVAEMLFAEDDRVLGGEGALQYARKNGFEEYNPETELRRNDYEAKKKSLGLGTVGCVALDANGKLAVATSTGGKGFELVGRISDSATTAGNFANAHAAVSCTGVGEDIVSVAVASSIVTRITDGQTMKTAFDKTFEELKEFDGFAGAIAINNQGEMYHQDSHPSMVFASFDGEKLEVFQ